MGPSQKSLTGYPSEIRGNGLGWRVGGERGGEVMLLVMRTKHGFFDRFVSEQA